MTTCVPIKLGGVMTHRLVMRVMCWQPGNRQAFFLKKNKEKKHDYQRVRCGLRPPSSL